jgi:hypothetical protein
MSEFFDPRFADTNLEEQTTGELDLEARSGLRRVVGLSTELQDVTEVEYRQLRLEKVVLIGVWTDGDFDQTQRSLAELAQLAETAGSQVLMSWSSVAIVQIQQLISAQANFKNCIRLLWQLERTP